MQPDAANHLIRSAASIALHTRRLVCLMPETLSGDMHQAVRCALVAMRHALNHGPRHPGQDDQIRIISQKLLTAQQISGGAELCTNKQYADRLNHLRKDILSLLKP